MYDELVKRLRERAEAFDYDGWVETASDCEKAADAIEELQKAVSKRPHGRLIDADALKENWTHRDLDLFAQGWDYLKDLNRAPTIIPASFENLPKNARYSQDNPAEEGE